MKKDYRDATKAAPRLIYPVSLQDYVGHNINIFFANPDSKIRDNGKLTKRRNGYYVGSRAVSLGDRLFDENMEFIGLVERPKIR